MNRRTFLQSSTAVIAAATAPAIAAPPSEQLHFALIGAGNQGRHIAWRLGNEPGAKMTAVCDINPYSVAEAKKMSSDATYYQDWNELLAKEKDLQAVIVALPEHTHAPAAIAAMNAGLDVFCEKPMAYSLEDTRKMMEVRDATGRVLQIGQQRRSNPLYYLAERLIQKEGIIGEPTRVDAFWDRSSDWKISLPSFDKNFEPWGFPSPDHLVNWRLYREYGHGLMTENGTHQLDAASWLLGGARPESVSGHGSMLFKDGRETYDIVTADYRFDTGVLVRFCQDLHQGFNFQWSYGELILGKEGALRVTAEQQLVRYDKQRRATKVSVSELGELEIADVRCDPAEMLRSEADRQGGGLRSFAYQNQVRIFLNSIKTRSQPSCTGEIGHNSLAATVIGAESQYEGTVKHFNADTFA